MKPIETRRELRAALGGGGRSGGEADRLITQTARLLQLPVSERMPREDLLLICEALAGEGGSVQRIAETIASETLRRAA